MKEYLRSMLYTFYGICVIFFFIFMFTVGFNVVAIIVNSYILARISIGVLLFLFISLIVDIFRK